MRMRKSQLLFLLLMGVLPGLAAIHLFNYRCRVIEPPLMPFSVSPVPAAVQNGTLPRLSPRVPWHAVTFLKQQTARGNDTAESVFTDSSIYRHFQEIIYPEFYESEQSAASVLIPLLLLHSKKLLSPDEFIGCSSLYLTFSPFPDSTLLYDVRVRLLKRRSPFTEDYQSNILQQSQFTVPDSLRFPDGFYIEYHEYNTKNGPEELNCRWSDGPWMTRITVKTKAVNQRHAGHRILEMIRNDIFGYYRVLNRRFAKESS